MLARWAATSIAAGMAAILLASVIPTAVAPPPLQAPPQRELPLQELRIGAAAAVAAPHAAPLVVIDPGHSGKYIRSRDKKTGLRDIDYPNYPEIYETFDIGSCVAKALKADGYRVILTKKHALDSVSLAARARIANWNKAALAISIHNDHGVGSKFQATYDQRGLKGPNGRYHAMYRGSGSHRTVFHHPTVAKQSQRYARIIAAERSKAQRRKVSVAQNSFAGRPPLEPGNLAVVQLLATVPWVYNEMGARTGRSIYQATTITSEARYARGLIAGVEAAIPLASRAERMNDASLRHCLTNRVDRTQANTPALAPTYRLDIESRIGQLVAPPDRGQCQQGRRPNQRPSKRSGGRLTQQHRHQHTRMADPPYSDRYCQDLGESHRPHQPLRGTTVGQQDKS